MAQCRVPSPRLLVVRNLNNPVETQFNRCWPKGGINGLCQALEQCLKECQQQQASLPRPHSAPPTFPKTSTKNKSSKKNVRQSNCEAFQASSTCQELIHTKVQYPTASGRRKGEPQRGTPGNSGRDLRKGPSKRKQWLAECRRPGNNDPCSTSCSSSEESGCESEGPSVPYLNLKPSGSENLRGTPEKTKLIPGIESTTFDISVNSTVFAPDGSGVMRQVDLPVKVTVKDNKPSGSKIPENIHIQITQSNVIHQSGTPTKSAIPVPTKTKVVNAPPPPPIKPEEPPVKHPPRKTVSANPKKTKRKPPKPEENDPEELESTEDIPEKVEPGEIIPESVEPEEIPEKVEPEEIFPEPGVEPGEIIPESVEPEQIPEKLEPEETFPEPGVEPEETFPEPGLEPVTSDMPVEPDIPKPLESPPPKERKEIPVPNSVDPGISELPEPGVPTLTTEASVITPAPISLEQPAREMSLATGLLEIPGSVKPKVKRTKGEPEVVPASGDEVPIPPPRPKKRRKKAVTPSPEPNTRPKTAEKLPPPKKLVPAKSKNPILEKVPPCQEKCKALSAGAADESGLFSNMLLDAKHMETLFCKLKDMKCDVDSFLKVMKTLPVEPQFKPSMVCEKLCNGTLDPDKNRIHQFLSVFPATASRCERFCDHLREQQRRAGKNERRARSRKARGNFSNFEGCRGVNRLIECGQGIPTSSDAEGNPSPKTPLASHPNIPKKQQNPEASKRLKGQRPPTERLQPPFPPMSTQITVDQFIQMLSTHSQDPNNPDEGMMSQLTPSPVKVKQKPVTQQDQPTTMNLGQKDQSTGFPDEIQGRDPGVMPMPGKNVPRTAGTARQEPPNDLAYGQYWDRPPIIHFQQPGYQQTLGYSPYHYHPMMQGYDPHKYAFKWGATSTGPGPTGPEFFCQRKTEQKGIKRTCKDVAEQIKEVQMIEQAKLLEKAIKECEAARRLRNCPKYLYQRMTCPSNYKIPKLKIEDCCPP